MTFIKGKVKCIDYESFYNLVLVETNNVSIASNSSYIISLISSILINNEKILGYDKYVIDLTKENMILKSCRHVNDFLWFITIWFDFIDFAHLAWF